MILNIYMHKNIKIDCFTQPYFSDVDPDKFAINEERALTIADLKSIVQYKNLHLYFVGVFDDLTGEIITKDENGEPLIRKLLDCHNLVMNRLSDETGVDKDEIESVPITQK